MDTGISGRIRDNGRLVRSLSSRIIGGLIVLLASSAWAQPRLLVFSGQRATSTKHGGLEWGVTLVKSIATKAGFGYDASVDPAVFTDANLAKYQAIFMNCNCHHTVIMTQPQRDAVQRFIQRGGGWAGTHCAAALEMDWMWYVNLLGAVHREHTPGSVPGVLKVENKTHASMTHFKADTWNLSKEELYYYLNTPAPSWRPNPVLAKVNVLLTFQSWTDGQGKLQTKPTTTDTSSMGALSWYHEYDGGRSWYTGLGHEQWLYSDSVFINHLTGGLKYVLRMDGTTGIAAKSPSPYDQRPRTFIGEAGGNSGFAIGTAEGYRLFDIRGNRLREASASAHSPYAPFVAAIAVGKE